ncbi:hypothetical protein Tco_0783795 [Tanacetum coccineum]
MSLHVPQEGSKEYVGGGGGTLRGGDVGEFKYGYCKNLKKTVKTGQTQTRERKENTRAGRMLSKNENLFDWECKTNDAPIDEAECFDPGGDNDEVDAFLAIEVPTYIEGYYDSEGDVLYLESLLSEDTTHNLSPEEFFDHEPQQLRNELENEPLITFSPKSDPLHHEFTSELITIPPGIVREQIKPQITKSTKIRKGQLLTSLSTTSIVINMPRATVGDTSLTRSYIPKVSQTPGIAPSIAHFYKPIRDRCIHEGRVVDQLYYTSDHIDHCFSNIRLYCLYEINEPIVPRFVLDFYSQVTLQRDASGVILISFMIQNEFITLSLQQFGQILRIPFDGQADVIKRVMRPLALRQTRRPRSDRGKARHSVSSTSAHHNHGYSSHQGDDDEDDGAFRASTPSPTTYLKSLKPLDYQQYEVPTSSEQNDDLLFERQTDLLNQTQQMHKELRGGFKSFGKALRGVFGKKKK